MATIEITAQNLQSTIEKNQVVLIDFWADWCGPCKMFGPVFEKASEKHPDLVFGKCDTETQPEVAAAFGIQSIPTLAIFKDGDLIFLQAGALSANALEQLIEKVRALDMGQVRQQAEQKPAAGGKRAPAAKPQPPKTGQAPKSGQPAAVVTTMASGEGLALMADDYNLRRQGVTRSFLEKADEIEPAHRVLEFYRRLRQSASEQEATIDQLRSEFERLRGEIVAQLSSLDADSRGEIKGILRAIEQMLKT